jgi:hypothetical protein
MLMGYNIEKVLKNEKIKINVPNLTFARKLYKKSQYLNSWNERYTAINSQGLYSFQENTPYCSPSFSINPLNTK